MNQASKGNFDVIALPKNKLDITNIHFIRNAIEKFYPNIIINAAAYTAVDKAEEEKELAFCINRTGAKNLAQACKEYSLPLIHISTDYIFDGTTTTAYSECDIPNPINAYGLSKWAGEEEIRKILAEHIILRTSWVFAAQGNNFVKTILRAAKSKNELKIVSDQYGAPTSAVSIAKCILFICKKYQNTKLLPWGTFHFTGTPYSSWYEFAVEILNKAVENQIITNNIKLVPISSSEYPTLASRPRNTQLDCHKIHEILVFKTSPWIEDLELVIAKCS